MPVIHIPLKTEETQRLRVKFVLYCPICALNLKIKRANFCRKQTTVFHLTWLCASWTAGTPRLRNVRNDRPVYMSGGAFLLESLSLVLHARLASPSRLPDCSS